MSGMIYPLLYLDSKITEPKRWGFGEPSSDLDKSCAVMSTETMALKAVPCNHSHTYLCQKQGNLFNGLYFRIWESC